MRTTILMLSVDEAPLLEVSLPAALRAGAADVVVIDNACADATAALGARLGVRVVATGARVSYAAAMNAGLRACAGAAVDAVLLLNADCVVADGFLAPLEAALGDGVGAVAPRLVRSTGMAASERLDVLDAAGMVIDRRRKNALVDHGAPLGAGAVAGPCFGGDGACVLYRRAVLDACAVDGEVFDEDMALWASDADLAWRAQTLGWSARYEPAAVAWHKRFYSPSTRAALPVAHRNLQFRNRLLMIVKNDTLAGVARDLPWILGWEVLSLGHALLRERSLLRAYADAVRLLPGALRRRRALGVRRRRAPFGLRAPRH